MKHAPQRIPVILGPTASGKTSYAIQLAKQCNGAIISADSRQVYSHMNIGTAKPKEAWSTTTHTSDIPDIIDTVPHYLINITKPNEPYTLSGWLKEAKRLIPLIRKNNQVPIIAGGTMLYIDALADGYDLPTAEPNLELRADLEKKSPEELYAMLSEKDPNALEFIEPYNTRRIIRALEVMNETGKKFSELRTASESPYTFARIGIFPEWGVLRSNVEKRSRLMLGEGLIEEVQKFREAYPASPLLQTINYKEGGLLLDNKISEEEAIALMTQATMRYAHRQMSWWKRRNDIAWVCA